MLPALLLLAGPVQGAVRGPAWFTEGLVYARTFDAPDRAPEVCAPDITGGAAPVTRVPGFLGNGTADPLVLQGPLFSPHRPWTLSFWWSLPRDLPIDGGYSLFKLNGKGFVGAFTAGKGEWCALQRPAGVLQVYYFTGIQNVNGIYDFDLCRTLDLRAGTWHHTAVIFRQASVVELYTDGKLACAIHLTGRAFSPSDNLQRLEIGGGICFDEVAVLNRAIDRDLLADYLEGMRRLREYATPAH